MTSDAPYEQIGWGPYHLRFKNFDPRTIEASEALLTSNPWIGHKEQKAQGWASTVAAVYDMDAPQVRIRPEVPGLGCYLPRTHQILMPQMSVTTLFHEFRHAMQLTQKCTMVRARYGDTQHEEDARAWSLSLFYTLSPGRFVRMVRAGKIVYVPADTEFPGLD